MGGGGGGDTNRMGEGGGRYVHTHATGQHSEGGQGKGDPYLPFFSPSHGLRRPSEDRTHLSRSLPLTPPSFFLGRSRRACSPWERYYVTEGPAEGRALISSSSFGFSGSFSSSLGRKENSRGRSIPLSLVWALVSVSLLSSSTFDVFLFSPPLPLSSTPHFSPRSQRERRRKASAGKSPRKLHSLSLLLSPSLGSPLVLPFCRPLRSAYSTKARKKEGPVLPRKEKDQRLAFLPFQKAEMWELEVVTFTVVASGAASAAAAAAASPPSLGGRKRRPLPPPLPPLPADKSLD